MEDAIKVLDRVRPEEDVRSGMSRIEVEAIDEAIEYERQKAPWSAMIVSLEQPSSIRPSCAPYLTRTLATEGNESPPLRSRCRYTRRPAILGPGFRIRM